MYPLHARHASRTPSPSGASRLIIEAAKTSPDVFEKRMKKLQDRFTFEVRRLPKEKHRSKDTSSNRWFVFRPVLLAWVHPTPQAAVRPARLREGARGY